MELGLCNLDHLLCVSRLNNSVLRSLYVIRWLFIQPILTQSVGAQLSGHLRLLYLFLAIHISETFGYIFNGRASKIHMISN